MKKNEFRKLKIKKLEELKKSVSDNKVEISKILAKIASGQEKNLKKGRNLKKELAQTLTIIREMEIVQQLQEEERIEKKVESSFGKDI